MKFAEHQLLRPALLAGDPHILDCAETNLYRALAHLAPPPPAPLAPGEKVHRCHLATAWCARFGLPTSWEKRALISCGVRDSLARLFKAAADERALVWLPEDNYPVYLELAEAAGARVQTFKTLPAPRWPDGAPADGAELLVVTHPLKPLGRALNDDDVGALLAWLARDARRRVLLDAVYTFDTAFDAQAARLLASEQVVLLHSLTKGWLQPRRFGVALVPAQDVAALSPRFRADPPAQESLALARACLDVHAGTPRAIGAALEAANEAMLRALPAPVAAVGPQVPGYLSVVASGWRALLEEHRVLALPATVFGSADEGLSVLSSLAFAAAPRQSSG